MNMRERESTNKLKINNENQLMQNLLGERKETD